MEETALHFLRCAYYHAQRAGLKWQHGLICSIWCTWHGSELAGHVSSMEAVQISPEMSLTLCSSRSIVRLPSLKWCRIRSYTILNQHDPPACITHLSANPVAASQWSTAQAQGSHCRITLSFVFSIIDFSSAKDTLKKKINKIPREMRASVPVVFSATYVLGQPPPPVHC